MKQVPVIVTSNNLQLCFCLSTYKNKVLINNLEFEIEDSDSSKKKKESGRIREENCRNRRLETSHV